MLEYEIFYGPHGSAKDIYGLAIPLKKADIFLPEDLGWSPIHLFTYNAVSRGVLTPQAAARKLAVGTSHLSASKDTVVGFFDMVYKSHKPIAFIDVPDSHPLTARFVKNASSGFRLGREFSETLRYAEDHLRVITAIDLEREDYEVAHLDPTVDVILKLNNALARRDKVRVLLFQGATHTRIGDLLKASDKTVTQTFAYEPFIYPFQNEVTQRFKRGEYVDEELMARAVMEMVVFLPTLLNATKDSRAVFEYSRKAISRFSFQEIERSFQEARNTGSYNTLTSLMQEKAIPHPNSEQDIYAFLQS